MSTNLGDVGGALRALFGTLLSDPDRAVDKAAAVALQAAGEEVLAKSIELAPHRTGDLENSGSLVVAKGVATVGFDVDYAAEAHELPENAVGPGTQAKAGNELGPAGPKFLERPIIAMESGRFLEIAGEMIGEQLEVEIG